MSPGVNHAPIRSVQYNWQDGEWIEQNRVPRESGWVPNTIIRVRVT